LNQGPKKLPLLGFSAYGTPEQKMAARIPSEPSGFGAAIMEPQAVQERENLPPPEKQDQEFLGATTPSVGENRASTRN